MDAAKEWLTEHKGELDEEMPDYYANAKVLNEDCTMDLIIYASCAADETAVDAGDGKGGLWTNKYIANGNMNPGVKTLISYTPDG